MNVSYTRFALVERKGEQVRLSAHSLNQFVKNKKDFELEQFYKVVWTIKNKK